MNYVYSVILFFLCLASYAVAEDSRIFMNSFINSQPIKLMFDTGAEGPVLFRKTAKRLNLSVKEAPDNTIIQPGQTKVAWTERCKFKLNEKGMENTIHFAVVDIPDYLEFDFDGILGWGAIKSMTIEIDPSSHRLRSHDALNFDTSKWKCLDILKDTNLLIIKTSDENDSRNLLLFDTGDPKGLTVKNELWQQLIADANNLNITLSAMYFPGLGLVVHKETWASEIVFDDLTLHEIPVQNGLEADHSLMNIGVDGSLGMWGLSCYQWIIDGSAGKIYFKENELIRIPEMYEYNRLGAVFVPDNIQTGNALIAHVIEHGPAWRAGIRQGDKLLKIGELDATKWRTDPNVMPLSRFWEKPAGTKINLTLLRSDKQMEIKVALEEIFK